MPDHIHKIPIPAQWVFRLLLPRADFLYLMGDYTEIYNRIAREKGKGHADLWIARQTGRSIPKYLSDALYWRLIMLINTIKVMFRGFKRHKGFTFINFAGLAIGLSVTLIITFYIMDDLKFDRFHPNADRIYRILSVGVKRGTKNSITSGPLVQAFKQSIPEVKFATRITPGGRIPVGPEGTDFRSADEGSILRIDCILADTDFFNVFDFKILEGNSGEALGTPGSVFLTPQTAQALFGDEHPIGKPIAVRYIENAYVAGLVEAPPQTSHIRFGMVAPLIPSQNPVWWDNWENLALRGYVRLDKSADRQATQEKMVELARKSEFPQIFEPRIQPLLDIHLGSEDHRYDSLNAGKNDIVVVYAMGVIGILILLVACINFVNLSTSRAGMRAREVGMRKVSGSSQRQLIAQFLGESVVTTILTFMVAVLVVQISLPYLSSILDKHLSLSLTRDLIPLIALFLTAVFIGVLSGVYPSFVLSSFKPVNVLRGNYQTGIKGAVLRRVLVVFQFGVTTALLVGVLVVLAQIRYLRSMDMGYNRDQVLVLVNRPGEAGDLLKERLLTMPSVLSAGRIDAVPGPNFTRLEIIPEGFTRPSDLTASRFHIDADLFETLEISLLQGRNFSPEYPTDLSDGIIVNETLLRKAGYDEALGRKIGIVGEEGNILTRHIIGVVKDFHYTTPRQVSEPMMFLLEPVQSFLLMVRIAPGRIPETLSDIEGIHKELFPERQLNRFFLQEDFDRQFDRDRAFMRNMGIFAGIAIFIACLGLIGLVAYSVEQRRKEIAIRKVLGSGENKIFVLLAADFLKWIIIANLIAWPLSHIAMARWLNDFVFRTPFRPWPFLAASAGTLLISLLTISFQTLRATRTNPADILRQEG